MKRLILYIGFFIVDRIVFSTDHLANLVMEPGRMVFGYEEITHQALLL
jgi:hypothetical protein